MSEDIIRIIEENRYLEKEVELLRKALIKSERELLDLRMKLVEPPLLV
ncbi:hypothetical protein LCGC14_1858590 [marine sediment metagenome]|uniref:Uncharacterized protein n=1 Tax=marine sediment metagenome TaxID=412755 RepID=A0A0F9GWL7_9ZZZZ